MTTVKYQLEQEEKNLKLRQDTLFGSMTHVKEHLEKLQQADQKVQILNGKHSFLAPDIAIATLTAEEETDFSYRQQQFIEGLQKKLDELRGNVERHATVVFNSKDAFIKFCQLQVSEVRLRNTIIDGVQLKTSYEELVKHQQSMGQTIHISRQYTQENIKNHDKDLVQFVKHIHVHLRKVEEELKQIPRKTKVHVDGEDILIYRFTIPEWSDEEGLAQIRARIDWIMDQLEQIEQRTMDEQESKQKARKQLEEWLSTVQLLRYITQNKEWRIACRKVMNSNRIAKAMKHGVVRMHGQAAKSGVKTWHFS